MGVPPRFSCAALEHRLGTERDTRYIEFDHKILLELPASYSAMGLSLATKNETVGAGDDGNGLHTSFLKYMR